MSYITDESENGTDIKIDYEDRGSGRPVRRIFPKLASTAVALVATISVVFATNGPAFAATNPPGEDVHYQPERFIGDVAAEQVATDGTMAEARTRGRGVLLRVWRADDGGNNLWYSVGDGLDEAVQLPGAPQSRNSPTVVPFGYNQWAIFHRGLDNHIYYGFMDESQGFSGWRDVFGQATSLTPAVTQLGDEHPFELYMVYRSASTSAMWGTYYNGFWHDPVFMGGSTVHSPGVTWNPRSNNGNGALYAAHTGTDGHVYLNTQSYGGQWLGWFSLGGQLISGPAIATAGSGNMQLAGRAPDNHIWFQEVDSGGGHVSGWAQDYDAITVGWAPFLSVVAGAIYTIATSLNDHRAWYKRSFNGDNW